MSKLKQLIIVQWKVKGPKEACNLPLLLYQCFRRHVLAYVVPCYLALEEVSLLLPEAITNTEIALHTIFTLAKFVLVDGVQAIHHMSFFPAINRILPLIRHNTAGQFHIIWSNLFKLHTLNSQNFLILWELWKFQLLTPRGSWDIAIWKFGQNTSSGPKFAIYAFFNNFWSKGPIKLKFGTGMFFGMRSPKITLRIHKNKPVFSYFTF